MKLFFINIILYYEKIYKIQQYKPKFFGLFINPFYIARKALFKNINLNKNHLKGKILDYGCGNSPYKDLFNYEEYLMADIYPNNENTILIIDYKVPYDDNFFDSIICTEVIEHVDDENAVIEEFNRLLKLGGKLLITTPFVWPIHAHPYDFKRYTLYGLEKLLERNGFKIIISKKTSNFIETLFQLKLFQWFLYLKSSNLWLNSIISLLLCPLTFLAIFMSVFSRNQSLYLNNFIIAINDKKSKN